MDRAASGDIAFSSCFAPREDQNSVWFEFETSGHTQVVHERDLSLGGTVIVSAISGV
jgi:hypothetical protein